MIQGDLRNRSDLATIITTEVVQRIGYYQNEPFSAQEATDTSITTVAGTATYTLPTTIRQVTGAWYLYGGNTWLRIRPTTIEIINDLDNISPPTQSPPTDYAIYGGLLRLFPVPSGAWNIKLNCIQVVAVPATGGTSNFWTIDACALIRHATVAVVASQYLHDPELASRAIEMEQREFQKLMMREIELSATGRVASHW